jgi:hypothetical protein
MGSTPEASQGTRQWRATHPAGAAARQPSESGPFFDPGCRRSGRHGPGVIDKQPRARQAWRSGFSTAKLKAFAAPVWQASAELSDHPGLARRWGPRVLSRSAMRMSRQSIWPDPSRIRYWGISRRGRDVAFERRAVVNPPVAGGHPASLSADPSRSVQREAKSRQCAGATGGDCRFPPEDPDGVRGRCRRRSCCRHHARTRLG